MFLKINKCWRLNATCNFNIIIISIIIIIIVIIIIIIIIDHTPTHLYSTEDIEGVLDGTPPPPPPPKETKRSGSLLPELDALESVLQGFNQPGDEEPGALSEEEEEEE